MRSAQIKTKITVMRYFLICSALINVLCFSTVLAASMADTEEVSYDDLLQQLRSHKSKYRKETVNSYDRLRIHTRMGLVSSFSSIAPLQKQQNWQQSGIQLSIGADLFSENWYTEGSFRNYGVSTKGREELSLRQLDFKIGYTDIIHSPWSFDFGAGLSTRTIEYRLDSIKAEETSPAFLLYGGLRGQITPIVSMGFEVGGRSPFANSNIDRGSIEMGFLVGLSL